MNQQIIVDQNLVMFGNDAHQIDCSELADAGVAFVGVDGKRRWLETEPFTGPIEDADFTVAERTFAEAQAMADAKNAPSSINEWATDIRVVIEDGRKDAETQGVVINGIRYAGDPGNRQALREALDLATETGLTVFPSWKDSDGEFRAELPVADIHEALMAIAARRSQLIAREGELNAQVDAALESGDRGAMESITWPTTP